MMIQVSKVPAPISVAWPWSVDLSLSQVFVPKVCLFQMAVWFRIGISSFCQTIPTAFKNADGMLHGDTDLAQTNIELSVLWRALAFVASIRRDDAFGQFISTIGQRYSLAEK